MNGYQCSQQCNLVASFNVFRQTSILMAPQIRGCPHNLRNEITCLSDTHYHAFSCTLIICYLAMSSYASVHTQLMSEHNSHRFGHFYDVNVWWFYLPFLLHVVLHILVYQCILGFFGGFFKTHIESWFKRNQMFLHNTTLFSLKKINEYLNKMSFIWWSGKLVHLTMTQLKTCESIWRWLTLVINNFLAKMNYAILDALF